MNYSTNQPIIHLPIHPILHPSIHSSVHPFIYPSIHQQPPHRPLIHRRVDLSHIVSCFGLPQASFSLRGGQSWTGEEESPSQVSQVLLLLLLLLLLLPLRLLLVLLLLFLLLLRLQYNTHTNISIVAFTP